MDIPIATYRIQLTPDFGFREAARIVGYLADLGISHLYVSPIFKARPGSRHGYDGVDAHRLNPELGAPGEFESLTAEVRRHGLGWIQDIVPNHMAFDPDNTLLMDILENGFHSKYAGFFDIDWDHPDPVLNGRLPAPFLGDPYAHCLEHGDIKIIYDIQGFKVAFYDWTLPLRFNTYAELLQATADRVADAAGETLSARRNLADMVATVSNLAKAGSRERRYERVETVKTVLRRLRQTEPAVAECLDRVLAHLNGRKGDPQSYAGLDRLLSRQVFRLRHWETANQEINYRRFFGLNELIALRQEDADVFDHTHALVFKMIRDGVFSGLRIDHVDGLADPAGYLKRLRSRVGETDLLVEKILASGERLPASWPVQGTTGYEFGAQLNAIFVRRENADTFTGIYHRFSGRRESWERRVRNGKRRVLSAQLGGELDNLTAVFKRIAVATPLGRDITTRRLKAALTELAVSFPVYRTYIDADGAGEADRRYIQTAVETAVLQRPRLRPELAFLRDLLLDRLPAAQDPGESGEKWRERHAAAITGFQQLTAPLTAKGLEDTALYNYNRLTSLNEVGGDPDRFGCALDTFHEFVRDRRRLWPRSMNSTSTHDSKRGEDVRARINVLSELPEEWEYHLQLWRGLNREKRSAYGDRAAPDANEEYLLYQTLIGTWPVDPADTAFFTVRLQEYVVKAAREAKAHTSWLTPDTEYEALLTAFVARILDPAPQNRFLEAFYPFAQKVMHYGVFNSLAQTLIKITAPGVPDFYQGAELADLNLVDPDNRRPVDFEQRRRLLSELGNGGDSDGVRSAQRLLADKRDGRLKLFVIARTLQARQRHPDLFLNGKYLPLATTGRHRRHVAAFARKMDRFWSVSVVPRFLTDIVLENQDPLGPGVWADTAVGFPEDAPESWENACTKERLTGRGSLDVGTVLQHFPVACLMGETTP
jgi:(1->4)-alpha-D-glucan 1-alpha-D-glucosylmutase